MISRTFLVLGVGFWLATTIASAAPKDMVSIPSGAYPVFIKPSKKKDPDTAPASVAVPSFRIDRGLVTNSQYREFVRKNPEWKKSRIKRVFADTHYLESWSDDLKFEPLKANQPVTRVSWFAASAYCESQGKSLPTTDQYELALFDKGRNQEKLKRDILAWYGKPNSDALPLAGSTGENGYGVSDLGFLVWEWTQDFNSFSISSDSRGGGAESNFVCGSGSEMGDAGDYASFMRYSFRSSLKANYTTANLGFRCAKDGLE